jgi:hypothetical protein
MRTQEGADEWMRTYNAELAVGKGMPFNLAGLQKQMGIGDVASRIHILGAPEEDDVDSDIIEEPNEDLLDVISRSHPGVPSRSSRNASTKQKVRMAKASRKKNRKRK